jgi:hypothetical protein
LNEAISEFQKSLSAWAGGPTQRIPSLSGFSTALMGRFAPSEHMIFKMPSTEFESHSLQFSMIVIYFLVSMNSIFTA